MLLKPIDPIFDDKDEGHVCSRSSCPERRGIIALRDPRLRHVFRAPSVTWEVDFLLPYGTAG
jgi:hypothetical protein